MMAFIRSLAILAGLCGLMLLSTSCSEDSDNPPSEPLPQWQTAQALLESMTIENGAVVSFIGPVRPGSVIGSANDGSEYVSLTVPEAEGTCCVYLFFINDHPDTRYVHAVRYAWLNLRNGHFEQVNASWWPRAIEYPVPNPGEFELMLSNTLSGVIFYYGRGGGAGFPPSYL